MPSIPYKTESVNEAIRQLRSRNFPGSDGIKARQTANQLEGIISSRRVDGSARITTDLSENTNNLVPDILQQAETQG